MNYLQFILNLAVSLQRNFSRQLRQGKKRIPSWDELREFRDKEILAAVAAINFDRDAAIYAHDQGLLVISTTDGDNFTLEPSERKKLKRF